MRILILNAYAFSLLYIFPISLFCQSPGLVEIEYNTPLTLKCGIVVSSIPSGTTPDFGIPIVICEFDPMVSVTYTDITYPGINAEEYSVTRIWKATDHCGNTDVCSRTIFVEDIEAPLIKRQLEVCPIECDSPLNFENATAVDLRDGEVLITVNNEQGKERFKNIDTHQLKCGFFKKDEAYFLLSAERITHGEVE